MNQEIQEVTPVIRKATPAADRLLALDAGHFLFHDGTGDVETWNC